MKSKNFHYHFGDITDANCMRLLVETIKPNEIYNLAAQSHVGSSFSQPINTIQTTALGPLNILEAIRSTGVDARFYQASSSEMFGAILETPQRETTAFNPRSPYGCAKVFGHQITKNYREAYGIYAVSGILFNHESERRGENFVTRKITRAVGRIVAGKQDNLTLGDVTAKRDWGYAPEYVDAMWRMMQQDVPQDYVIGTGDELSVGEFCKLAFGCVNLDWKDYVKFDESNVRPSEVYTLRADPSKAKAELDWSPRVKVHDLIKIMVDHDVALARREP
jgi:GDPmannose 4,6-dehydratase